MKRQRRVRYGIAALVLVFSAIASSFIAAPSAYAATRTWDGGGGNNLFSTAANWSSDTAPVDGDSIVINTAAPYSAVTDNDLVGLSLIGISFVGGAVGGTISGNDFEVEGLIENNTSSLASSINANLTLTGNTTFRGVSLRQNGPEIELDVQTYTVTFESVATSCLAVSSNIVGSGDLVFDADTIDLSGTNSSYTGSITISQGLVYAQQAESSLGSPSGGTVVSGTGSLVIDLPLASTTFTEPLTLSGSGYFGMSYLNSGSFGAGVCNYTNSGGINATSSLVTMTGDLTLLGDFIYDGYSFVSVTGDFTANGHTLSNDGDSNGTLIIGTDYSLFPVRTKVASDSQPSVDEGAGYSQVLLLDGERQRVSIVNLGTVRGVGTAAYLSSVSGFVAPGSTAGSAGRLTFAELVYLAQQSRYQVDIQDSSIYDSIMVGADFALGGPLDEAVNLVDVSLDTSFIDGWSIEQGDQFTIINNQSDTPVIGTFTGMAEGAQFVVEGITFSITYTGGDGNDVVLTALNTGSDPDAPNTGMASMLTSNPFLPLALGVLTAVLILLVARRRQSQH